MTRRTTTGKIQRREPHDKPYILFVGRLEVIKGLQTVIPLWEKRRDVDLLIAGTGNYGEELQRLAAGNPRIRFLDKSNSAPSTITPTPW